MAGPTLLCILDGFGLNPNPKANAVSLAKKPVIDELLKNYPNSTLVTFGEKVGLPEGLMGNSEVGHLNIGAGRIVEQWLLRINRVFDRKEIQNIPAYNNLVRNSASSPVVHLVGLYSDGGVHSHYDHLFRLIERLLTDTKSRIALHIITDGRDTSPQIAATQLARLSDFISTRPRCFIASISGRFYAMDRDKRWERTERAFQAIALGQAERVPDPISYLQQSYERGIGDEFIEPRCINPSPINKDDAIVFWNFRADRMRQLVAAISQENFIHFKGLNHPSERILCFTNYDPAFNLPYLFEQLHISNHLGQVISQHGLKQLRVAETEKYPHVTYFFNGGVEQALEGEERALVPSPRDVKTYDLKPEMSAQGVTEQVLKGIESGKFALIVVNFANCDMVGHTGVLSAAIKAVETVDTCLGKILDKLKSVSGQALIIADHGNAEQMINYEDGTPHTAHTTYPVPVILWDPTAKRPIKLRTDGILADVAPTILKMIGLNQPSEMTGRSLS